ncbi:MAG TPA: MBL fold metallo-hydrolase [Thermoanaerobaculaceae bacterium]|nr:MBL fold metallo-hydrolase [Thermoanaerobaculaceae bacterium]HPS76878.1 MBL fold metallo-hydrolase [Thermoanaerobaculaceae bacterium]
MPEGLRVITLELGPFQEHTVLLIDPPSRETLVVDPGFEAREVVATIHREGLCPVAIILTHGHIDHAFGAAELKAAFPDAPLLLHPDDLPLYEGIPEQARLFGLPEPVLAHHDGLLEDRQTLRVGGMELEVRHCPGHSPGHVVLLSHDPDAPLAVVGDVLFSNAVGRTDLWGGSFEDLEHSIRTVLFVLPDETRVIPGHGPETTIGEEKQSNPYVAAL